MTDIQTLRQKLEKLDEPTLNQLYHFSSYIDYTLLAPDASNEQIADLCNEAIVYRFKSVCVNPTKVKLCKQLLENQDVLVTTVVGFPLGQNETKVKVFEAQNAIKNGADEIDMVINIDDLKNRRTDELIKEINDVKKVCGDKILKVIVETCLLDDDIRMYAVQLVAKSKADFIKTSTGFSYSGADINDIVRWNEWRMNKKSSILIKAAGGIKNSQDFIDFIKCGSDRIGTSNGVKLMDDLFNLHESPKPGAGFIPREY